MGKREMGPGDSSNLWKRRIRCPQGGGASAAPRASRPMPERCEPLFPGLQPAAG